MVLIKTVGLYEELWFMKLVGGARGPRIDWGAHGPWAHGPGSKGPIGPKGPSAHGPGPIGPKGPLGIPRGDPPGIPRDPPWDPKGPPKIIILLKIDFSRKFQ